MHRSRLFLTVLILAALGAAAPVAAAPPPDEGAGGSFTLTVHSHSSQFTDTLFQTSPVPFPVTKPSSGTYSSIPCSRPAPFNDTALDFNPDYPGVDDPASVRHFVEVELTPTQGNRGTVDGEITTILCLDGAETESRLFFEFSGTYKQTRDGVKITGAFELSGGTGIFAGITGDGTIAGELTCLPSRNATCGELGLLSDAVFSLQGSYTDPTG